MLKTTQKEIKRLEARYNGPGEVWERVKKYQAEHNTSGIPSAYTLGLEVFAYSVGMYGCNGVAFRDLKTGEIYASGRRDNLIYIGY